MMPFSKRSGVSLTSSTTNMFSEKLTHVLARGFIVWLLIIFAETIHGMARTLLLEPLIGDFRAQQVSVFTGAAMIVVITFVFVRWLKGSGVSDFIEIGMMWVILTVGFELILGRFVMDVSWERIASDYNVFHGGLMLFGLLVMLLAPLLMAKFVDEI